MPPVAVTLCDFMPGFRCNVKTVDGNTCFLIGQCIGEINDQCFNS